MDTSSLIPEHLKNPGPAPPAVIPGEKSMRDFTIVKEIGEGSFSIVYHAREKEGKQRDVAIKMCFKKQLIRERRVESVHREKNLLVKLSTKEHSHLFVVSLMCTMQDLEHLYFVLSFAAKGDLLQLMNKQPGKKLSEEDSRFYAAELLESLAHIHSLSIVHRDVKPENILVRASGHILLSDFGSARDLSVPKPVPVASTVPGGRVRRASFVGTAQYVSPEVLKGKEVDFTCDYWAFGVCVYQFLTGLHCFHDESEYLMYQRIQKLLYKYPDEFPIDAKNLVDNLLIIESSDRLGSVKRGGIDSLKNHSFFKQIDWSQILEREAPEL